jgi:hypothetical protein
MRENCTSGSVAGEPGNRLPYAGCEVKMTLIPKKLQYVILAGFSLLLVTTLVRHSILEFDVDDLVSIGKGGFSEVYVMANNKKYKIEPGDIPRLLNIISKMNLQKWSGLKGEEWQVYCSLNFHKYNENILYVLNFETRKSMDGDILAMFQRNTGSSTYHYANYNGNNVVEYINKITHNQCIKNGPR